MLARLGGRARLAQDAGETELRGGEAGREGEYSAVFVLGAVQIPKLGQVDLAQRSPGEHLGPSARRRCPAQDADGRLRIARAQLERGAPDLGQSLGIDVTHRTNPYHVAGAGSVK